MNNPNKRTAILIAAFCLTLTALTALAAFGRTSQSQEKQLRYENWYGDMKKNLADHYTGKTVKLRMAIPATRRGLELFDGSFDRQSETTSAESLAQPGDDVTIKNFIVRDNDIELLLDKTGDKPKGGFFRRPKKPRIKLHFSRELAAKDLTIESINRWLAPTMDVAALTPLGAEPTTQASVAPTTEPATKPAPAKNAKAATNNSLGLPTAEILNNLPQTTPGFAELTVECSGKYARVYIDDAYSGFAPRTIRVRAGIHSIFVMADGYPAWEQRLFIPEGKVSVVKAELKK